MITNTDLESDCFYHVSAVRHGASHFPLLPFGIHTRVTLPILESQGLYLLMRIKHTPEPDTWGTLNKQSKDQTGKGQIQIKICNFQTQYTTYVILRVTD